LRLRRHKLPLVAGLPGPAASAEAAVSRQRGSTLFELVTVMAVVAIFAAVAVPSAAHVGSVVSRAEGARRLALVLRAAQAEAESRGTTVQVEVGASGDYEVSAGEARLMSGRLGAPVTSTYPGGLIEFSERGWASLPGSGSPRAGHFTVVGAGGTTTVTVQLSGCVRCV
jgi:prepilin-type N-terminal cleavage/methylation domain-containing protein